MSTQTTAIYPVPSSAAPESATPPGQDTSPDAPTATDDASRAGGGPGPGARRPDPELIGRLEEMVRFSYDVAGHLDAAADALDSRQRAVELRRLASDCRRQAGELRVYVVDVGGEPSSSGTLRGRIRTAWLALTSAVTSKSAASVLRSVIGVYEALEDEYGEVLVEAMGTGAYPLLERQHRHIAASRRAVRASLSSGTPASA